MHNDKGPEARCLLLLLLLLGDLDEQIEANRMFSSQFHAHLAPLPFKAAHFHHRHCSSPPPTNSRENTPKGQELAQFGFICYPSDAIPANQPTQPRPTGVNQQTALMMILFWLAFFLMLR